MSDDEARMSCMRTVSRLNEVKRRGEALIHDAPENSGSFMTDGPFLPLSQSMECVPEMLIFFGLLLRGGP